MYPKLLKAILFVSQQLASYANDGKLPLGADDKDFYDCNIQAFHMLPMLFEIVAKGYDLALNKAQRSSEYGQNHGEMLVTRATESIQRGSDSILQLLKRFALNLEQIFENLYLATNANDEFICL